ncbi:anthranilate synthase component I family protein [Leucobacter exalbidus]|uniref:anthranilate synthase component I family protein n=1 Tax=Leucobacter exalbidus TaxID=662960 RepID=UPI001AEB81F1
MRRPIEGSFDAETLARTLAAAGHPWCWLDGEAPAQGETQVSYFGATEHIIECARGSERKFLTHLRNEQDRRYRRDGHSHRHSHEDPQGSIPATAVRDGFHGGWVTALSYEFGVALTDLTPAIDDEPPAFALRLDAVLALTGDTLELRAHTHEALAAGIQYYASVIARARRGMRSQVRADTAHLAQTDIAWRRSGAAYETQVAKCQQAITAGDAYVICLTDSARTNGHFDPIDIYTRLRRLGTATRGGIISTGHRALISASPERFLSVRNREISTHPIKGTRPRDADSNRDQALAAELANDPKERAENLMIVDLMRNDLSRVCAPGSVGVREFLRVEQHPHVHQLVSTVAGQLADGLDVFDAIAACFPAGSMTGAPKRRAMQLLGELEAAPRGLYAGCFGWLDDGGDAELAMTIRGVELRGLAGARQTALVGAGGGITADSDPASEHAEKDLKAAAVLAALVPRAL